MARTLAATAIALACTAASGAAPDPEDEGLRFSITAELLHDDNLFRLPDGDPRTFGVATDSRSDTIMRFGAAARYEKLIGLQHVIGEVGLKHHVYDHNGNLDHTSGNALAKWLWAVGSQWDGELSYDYRRRLSGFGDVRANVKNLVDLNTLVASGGYWFHPSWRVGAGLVGFESDNSAPTQIQNDSEIVTAYAGVDYRTRAMNTIGAQLRRSEGRFPNKEVIAATLVNNQYTETSPGVVWSWNLTGQTRFGGRIGYTQRDHDQFSARDFSGPTFRLNYTGLPTGKLRIEADAWRDLWTAESETASYVVASGIRLRPSWYATAKITVRAALSYETRSYEGDPGVVLGTATLRDDTLRLLQLGVAYAVLRRSEILLTLERGNRDSNQPAFDYDYNSAWLSLKLGF